MRALSFTLDAYHICSLFRGQPWGGLSFLLYLFGKTDRLDLSAHLSARVNDCTSSPATRTSTLYTQPWGAFWPPQTESHAIKLCSKIFIFNNFRQKLLQHWYSNAHTYFARALKEWLKDLAAKCSRVCTKTSIFNGLKLKPSSENIYSTK